MSAINGEFDHAEPRGLIGLETFEFFLSSLWERQ